MAMSPRLLRPRATGFSPKNLTGLALWLDPTDSTSYTIETGVKEWRDKSGNGKHFGQTVTNNQPSLTTIGGKTALSFDGSNDHLLSSLTLFTGDVSFTMFQVFEATFPGNATGLFVHRSRFNSDMDVNDITIGLNAEQGSSWVFGTLRSRVAAGRSGATVNADQRFDSVNVSGTGASSMVGSFSSSPTNTHWFRGTAAPSSLGTSNLGNQSGMVIGCRNNATKDLFYLGKIGEMIAYNRALSTTERLRIESYLARKWGYTTA